MIFKLLSYIGVGLFACLGFAACPHAIHEEIPTGKVRHPVSIVEANIFVQQKKLLMNLKCFADDLELVQGLEPLADGSYDAEEMADAARDHAEFLMERIDLLDANGVKMQGKILESLAPEEPPEGIKQGDLMNLFCNFRYEYNYETPPEYITINQRMMGEGYLLPSELQILIKQAGSDTPYQHMMKPEMPETFRFDWSNPALNEDASPEQWESWFEDQRQKTLGITSYSSVYSFVYITNHEVRHEVLIPLASLSLLIDFERADPSFLDIPEQDAAKQRIIDYFSVGNDIEIDGVPVKPVFDRIDFYGLDLRDFAVQAERRKISMASGRVGVIMSYPTKSPPTSVKVEWKTFNEAIKTVDSVIIAYDDVAQTQFSKYLASNVYEWQSPERPPLPEINDLPAEVASQIQPSRIAIGLWLPIAIGVLLLVFAGLCRSATLAAVACVVALISLATYDVTTSAPWEPGNRELKLADNDARSIFSRLHENVFRAFDYHQESDVYDALDHSVHGPLLQDLYLQIHQRLVMADQGGAAARIDAVELLNGQVVPSSGEKEFPGFTYRAKWNLLGTVEHWGHLHQRTNQFDAEFFVARVDGKWKITEMQSLDEKQIAVKTSLRKFGG